jgi:di/tricarboxylate transporter
MTLDAYLTLATLILTFALLIKTRLPPAAIFLGALALAITFQLAPTQECLKGFSNQGMLTVAVLFIVAAGMYATGAINLITDKIIGLPRRLMTAQIKILTPVAVGSAFLNNTPLVAMVIPVIRDLARTCRLPAKQLYIPMSFASILGGACTLIGTSTNLVIGGLVMDAIAHGDDVPGLREIRMFDPALVAVPAAVLGLVLIVILGRFLLPKDTEGTQEQVGQRMYSAEFKVKEGGRLVGKPLGETGLLEGDGYTLSAMRRQGIPQAAPQDDTVLEAGDVLTFVTNVDNLTEIWRKPGLLPNLMLPMDSPRHTHHLVKVVVSRRNPGVGRRVSELPPPGSPYRVKIVAICREGQPIEGPLRHFRIEAGDNVILEVNDDFFFLNRTETDFSLTRPLKGYHIQHTERALEAIAITGVMIFVVAMGWMSMLNASLLAAGAMLATGCLSMQTAAQSVDWSTLVVIACAIGLESAVSHSGLAEVMATLFNSIGGTNPLIALIVVFLGCTLMTNVITNNAAAAFMFPIALSMASQLGVNFMPFVITMMVGASCAFITPTGYQTNMMVWGPGGYAFTDYVKLGLPLTICVGVVSILIAPLVFPF